MDLGFGLVEQTAPRAAVAGAGLTGMGVADDFVRASKPILAEGADEAVRLGGRGAEAVGDAVGGLVKSGAEVTDGLIMQAMKDAPLRADQGAVSVPAIRRFVDMLAAGKKAPAIRVDNGIIVEGHHRYIAGRLFGTEPAVQAGTRAAHKTGAGKSWTGLFLDAVDWGNK